MADNIEQHEQPQQNQTQPEEQETSTQTTTTTMAEIESQPQHQNDNTSPTKKTLPNISFSIWPPTQRTREAVTSRLIETLSSPSVLSKRYGTVRADEASDLAKRIEEEAFSAANSSVSASSDAAADDGIEILQVYSKEISKRMLDSVKSRSGSLPTTPVSTPAAVPAAEEGLKKVEVEEPVVQEAGGDDGGAKAEE